MISVTFSEAQQLNFLRHALATMAESQIVVPPRAIYVPARVVCVPSAHPRFGCELTLEIASARHVGPAVLAAPFMELEGISRRHPTGIRVFDRVVARPFLLNEGDDPWFSNGGRSFWLANVADTAMRLTFV